MSFTFTFNSLKISSVYGFPLLLATTMSTRERSLSTWYAFFFSSFVQLSKRTYLSPHRNRSKHKYKGIYKRKKQILQKHQTCIYLWGCRDWRLKTWLNNLRGMQNLYIRDVFSSFVYIVIWGGNYVNLKKKIGWLQISRSEGLFFCSQIIKEKKFGKKILLAFPGNEE